MGGFFSQPKRTASATEMPTMAASGMGSEETPGMDDGEVPTTMAATTMAPTTMAPTTMAPTTMAPTTMAAPNYTGRFFTIGFMPHDDPSVIYSSGPGDLSYESSTSIKDQIDAILVKKNISKPYNYISLWNDGGFRLYNLPPEITSLPNINDPAAITYPASCLPLLSSLAFTKAGYVTGNKELYAQGPGSLSFKSSTSIKDQIDAILVKNNSAKPYNAISVFEDGGFRIYDTGMGISTSGDAFAATYFVKQKSTFASISRFGASGGGMLVLLLLLLVAAVLYYLYTQGKIKIPTFEQRMASFGKAIKTLRKRR